MRTYIRTPAIDRLLAKVSRDDLTGCWLYTGGLSSRGYGVIWSEGHSLATHRVSYENHVGPIPAGMHLDHLCRVRHCCNPAHLEPVTPRENLMRSPVAPAAVNAAKVECRRGHPFTDENTATGADGRTCRMCRREDARRYRTRRAAA